MLKKKIFALASFSLLLAIGVWYFASPTLSQADIITREQASRQSLAPIGVNAYGDEPTSTIYESIEPVAVNLADIPPGQYVPDTMYERWLRGELDIESEYRISESEVAELQLAALNLPPNPNIQIAESGPGLAAPTPGIAFDSLDFTECCGGGGSTPPDPDLAVGPNHLIAAVNLSFEIYDKTGTSLAGPTTYASFFSSLTPCVAGPNGAFDPTIAYDEEADRFAIGVDGNGTHFCIAVSQTNDPTGAYWLYAIPTQPVGGEFHDYPHIGVGDDHIVMGSNQFGSGLGCGNFEGRVWALDKSDMYAGSALSPITFNTGCEGTPQPLYLHGFNQGTWPSFGSTHYFATDSYDGCTLNIWEWNIPAAPSIIATFDLCTATGVAGGMPVDWLQSGGSAIQANDWRMRGFEFRNGSGWVADSISCNPGGGTVDCARWSEVDLLASPSPSLVQAGVFASDGEYRTFPDLGVNHCGDVALGYTKGSSSMFPSVWYTGRESSDPLGSMQAEAELKAGEVTYVAFDGSPYRWGDYSGMTIDPDGVTFWYLGEYSKNLPAASTKWGTYIGAFNYASCVTEVTYPQIEVDPNYISYTQPPNSISNHTLTISNTGTQTLTWNINEEITMAFPPLTLFGDDQPVIDDPAAAAEIASDDTVTFEVPADTPINLDSIPVYEPSALVLFDNGPLVNCPGCGVGGADESVLQTVSLGMSTFGFGHQIVNDNWVTDNFTVTDSSGWSIGTITFFAYQTTSPITSTMETVNWQIWDGEPGNGGSVIANGSGLAETMWSGIYRVSETTTGANTDRPIMANSVPINLSLAPGVYWISWQTGGSLASGPWAPPITVSGVITTGNGLQSVDNGVTWNPAMDGATTAQQGFPFIIEGAVSCTSDDFPWVTVSPVSGSNASGTSTNIDISFDSTGYSAGVYTGTICIDSNAINEPVVRVPITMTVPSYGVQLESNQAITATAGETVTYTLTVTNTGDVADVFDLSVSGNIWPTMLSDTTVALDPNEATTIEVTVAIPAGINDVDVATVTATSQSDATATDSVTLTTTAESPNIYLPIVMKP